MKKISILLLFIFLFLCGCSKVSEASIDDILNKLNEPITKQNTYHTGFKYYLPKAMSVNKYTLYNDEITTSDYIYYLYVDVISYYNNTENKYEENDKSYYSKKLLYNEKSGYLEINLKENDQYLIEIMFNYAKIEVMVDKDDINTAVLYCVSILRSIEYNNSVIDTLVTEEGVNYQEEVYNIFSTTSGDSDFLSVLETDQYVESEDTTIKDTDLIN